MPRVRLAVALLVPPPFAAQVDALRAAVGDRALGRVAPHLTLVPPVNVNRDRFGEALAVLREAGAATRPFTVHLGPPATFLPDTPVLHLPVSGDGAVAVGVLRERVFRGPLHREVTWPFAPHVTLADQLPEDRLHAAVHALAGFEVDVTFERVHLLHEQQHPDRGRVWTVLHEQPLSAPAVIGRGGLELELEVTERAGLEAEAFARREWPAADAAEFGEAAADRGRAVAITARRDGQVVGIARGQLRFGTAHLSELLVGAAVRGEGVGSHLVRAFEAHAREQGCRRLTVHTAAGSAAHAFYRRHGWRELQRLPDWAYGRDFVRLHRTLSTQPS